MAVVTTTSQGLERKITWVEFRTACDAIAQYGKEQGCTSVYGIPSSGCYVALEVSNRMECVLVNEPREGTLIVDDIIDSGKTMRTFLEGLSFVPKIASLVCREGLTQPRLEDVYAHETVPIEAGYVYFPWESGKAGPEDNITRLMQHIGVDVNEPGVKDTPKRVVKAFKEMTEGYAQDPVTIVGDALFYERADEIIMVKDIPFHSLCEHHMLPFSGTVTVGYIPSPDTPYVIGLSKIPRIVRCYAKRLQVQAAGSKRRANMTEDGLVRLLKMTDNQDFDIAEMVTKEGRAVQDLSTKTQMWWHGLE